jgi:anthranilate synthase/aminodeoxychorismate synthase-like glutamine amidotransferase
MVLLIDNYDSFTYNLYQQVSNLGSRVKVVKNDAISLDEIERLAPDRIIISAGPGRPESSGISRQIIKHFYKTVPILGVCLGQQCIGEVFGSNTVAAARIMHGKADQINHNGQGVFAGLPSPFTAARYHSLVVDALPAGFVRTAWSDDGSLMGLQHEKYPLHGVQFHPESFLTDHGELIMRNFLS